MFAYCKNNDVNMKDDSGKFPVWIVAGAVVGGLVSGISQVVSNVTTGQKWYKGVAGATLGGAVTGGILAATFGVGIVKASFAGAAVQSISNELESHITGEQKKWNVKKTVRNVVGNTIVNGALNTAFCELGGGLIKTNSGWATPESWESFLLKSYGRKVIAQTTVSNLAGHSRGETTAKFYIDSSKEDKMRAVTFAEK